MYVCSITFYFGSTRLWNNKTNLVHERAYVVYLTDRVVIWLKLIFKDLNFMVYVLSVNIDESQLPSLEISNLVKEVLPMSCIIAFDVNQESHPIYISF